jgi:hypothetical protein
VCSLIVLLQCDPEFPIIAAANRDESRDRPASPPGLFTGERRRVLSPRDRRGGGTWMGVNDAGWFAALTNVAGERARAGAPTRGLIPHLALDQADVGAAMAAVERAVSERPFNAFQLLLTDGKAVHVLRHAEGALTRDTSTQRVTLLSNDHAAGELVLPGLDAASAPGVDLEARLAALRPILLLDGTTGTHRVLKRGGAYGTVSSSLLAVPRADLRRLVWWYAAGPPDAAPYRNYGNLGRRLVEG